MTSPELMSYSSEQEGQTTDINPVVFAATPEEYQKRHQEILRMGDHGWGELADLRQEVPKNIFEFKGSVDSAVTYLENSPEGDQTLLVIDHNIPETAELYTQLAEGTRPVIKGREANLYFFKDKTHEDNIVAIGVSADFLDDLQKFVKYKLNRQNVA